MMIQFNPGLSYANSKQRFLTREHVNEANRILSSFLFPDSVMITQNDTLNSLKVIIKLWNENFNPGLVLFGLSGTALIVDYNVF